ncbi:hypothetical protein [Acinetobacter sp.]|uniref:hypothetical protein n=1 Tax=Acinetobacter sp. TaxID=472 RepID=UPI003751B501
MINILLIGAGIGTYYLQHNPELKTQFFATLAKLKQKAKDEWAKVQPKDKEPK